MDAVILKNITKTYAKGTVKALADVSLKVHKGELFGLIGPDGAGKTTLFRLLTTVLLPDSGSASVDGFDIVNDYKEIRKRVGYMPGKFSLYQDLTVEENLSFFATIFNTTIEENYDLIKDIYVQIEPFKDRRAGQLSGGMKQKLALCCALIHKPSVLFLDEPTTGVDAVSRKEFWEMLQRLKKQGITILVSTPYMDEASQCDRIALINHGQILSVDTLEHIIATYEGQLYAIRSEVSNGENAMYKLNNDLHTYPGTRSSFTFGEYLHLTFKDDNHPYAAEVLPYLQQKGHNNIEIKPIEAGIEDRFIQLLATDA